MLEKRLVCYPETNDGFFHSNIIYAFGEYNSKMQKAGEKRVVEQGLLVKLFYENTRGILREIRRIKILLRGAMSTNGIRARIKRFKETGKLGQPGRGRTSVDSVKTAVDSQSQTSNALLVEWLRQQTKLPHLSDANPQVYVETPLHPEKLTVCCALWAGGILLQNDEGHNVTVIGDRYRAMISNFFIPELNNHDVQELWFQQDGATCHTARATIDLLKDTFGDRLISRFGPANWPPRSCDLTPLDYFLWGYVKSLVYADKPQTLDHLEDNIRRVIVDIRPQMLEKVVENWTSRLDYI
ncbi:DUF4817 domain-containing protein [Trichonephila clavipes]|nr:DUF4817 domain-containing protein [Trichonephila clavipes]